MPLENGRQGTEKQNSENLHKAAHEGEGADQAVSESGAGRCGAGHQPPGQEPAAAIREEIEPEREEPESAHDARFAEASLAKKIIVFTLTTLLVLIALGAIYTFWPAGQMPMPH